jgi:hypothetical protein
VIPYLYRKSEGAQARKEAAEAPPFGPGFPPDIVARTERLEIWCSRFEDPGPDYSEVKAFDAQGQLLGSRCQDGY